MNVKNARTISGFYGKETRVSDVENEGIYDEYIFHSLWDVQVIEGALDKYLSCIVYDLFRFWLR